MYHHLRGQIVRKEPDKLIIETAGVGYLLSIPFSTYETLPSPPGEVLIYTHLYVREDQLRLYGFATERERSFFEQLISVSGVGPALALGMLSSVSLEELQQAILAENTSFLQKIKGVGKKTAQKISMELRDRVGKISMASGISLSSSPVFSDLEDAIRALISLGYTEELSKRAAQEAYKEIGGLADSSEIIRRALKYAR